MPISLNISQKLSDLLKKANIKININQKELLLNYMELLMEWSKKFNLTAIKDPNKILTHHLLDSLVISPYLQGSRFIDVGSGAGLPGIPLSIINPQWSMTLLDSVGKKIRFLQHVKSELNLSNIDLIYERAENFKPNVYFDGVITRAFSSLEKMVHLCHHLLSPTGNFYALKAHISSEELIKATKYHKKAVKKIVPLVVPELGATRNLVIL